MRPGSTGNISRDASAGEREIVFVVEPSSSVANFHAGRSPPGAWIVMRSRDPARKAYATGKIGTRTNVNSSAGRSARSAATYVGTTSRSFESSSGARYDARSTPNCT